MNHRIIKVAEKKDLAGIRKLAEKIWPATYADILSAGQIDYMMGQIYSMDSLLQQIDEYHHIFLILEYDAQPAGFASYSLYPEEKKGKLQKIYVDPALQGKGLGQFLLKAVEERVKATGCHTLHLNVNRHNKARSFYEKQGFVVIRNEDIDIGSGFFMNDYVMQKNIVNSR